MLETSEPCCLHTLTDASQHQNLFLFLQKGLRGRERKEELFCGIGFECGIRLVAVIELGKRVKIERKKEGIQGTKSKKYFL